MSIYCRPNCLLRQTEPISIIKWLVVDSSGQRILGVFHLGNSFKLTALQCGHHTWHGLHTEMLWRLLNKHTLMKKIQHASKNPNHSEVAKHHTASKMVDSQWCLERIKSHIDVQPDGNLVSVTAMFMIFILSKPLGESSLVICGWGEVVLYYHLIITGWFV